MLAGCSYYNQFVERMQTDTLEYQCDQKPLTVHRNNARQQVSFIYDNQQLNLSRAVGFGALHRRRLCVLVKRRYRHRL